MMARGWRDAEGRTSEGQTAGWGWRRAAGAALLAVVVTSTFGCSADGPAQEAGGAVTASPRAETPPAGWAEATAAWDEALHRYQHDGGLDYAGLAADRGGLDTFLAALQEIDPASLGDADRLALWINAYNAVTVSHILERYPGIESIREIDGVFDAKPFPVGGEAMALDAIEAKAREVDPRVHFAVVCASYSCPDLRGEAFVGERIDEQLSEQLHAFLRDEEKGLRYDAKDDVLWLSSIFKWYAQDFTGSSRVVAYFARGGVAAWVIEHAPQEIAERLKDREPSVRYLDYDWSLNDRPQG